MVRAFVAVDVPSDALMDLPLRRAVSTRHLTLRFLGETPDHRLETVAQAMHRAVEGCAPFELEWKGVGAFPNATRPRIVWAGIGAGSPELVRLASRLESELELAGWPKEPRPFVPHLTLLRVGTSEAAAAARDLLALGPDRPLGRIRVEEIVLNESQLKPEGALHLPRARAPLRGLPNRPVPSSAPRPSDATDRA
ncbi:MAG: RNA 2',3'-cyclic phosphodiesterase [Thermoplasmata archaeon]